MRWAYALRDAVALLHPDVVVSHLDETLEADAVASADLLDLANAPPVTAAVELVATLAGIFRGAPPVAATLTGPAALAARIGDASEDGLLDAADALAALARAYADAGANVLVVFEPPRSGLLGPIERAAAHRRVELVVIEPGAYAGTI